MSEKTEVDLPPAIIVIFGITGDLAQRKLMPALYHLMKSKTLHPKTQIVGVTRRSIAAEEVVDVVRLCSDETDGVCDPVALEQLRSMLTIRHMDLSDGGAYDELRMYLDGLDATAGEPLARLFYLSIPPNTMSPIVKLLGEHGLSGSSSRLLVEKPFGYDLASAQELIAETSQHFQESQLFRIDHYLAKETVQNILTFRFHNPIFESLWNAQHVCRIEVEASETIGIEGRTVFYEQTGALRDLVQSHLLQLLAVVTMERPSDMSADAVHAARLQLLEGITPLSAEEVAARTVRGQYDGYRAEAQNPRSFTETFAALRLDITNDRWRGVPIIIKTGKALKQKQTCVRLFFKSAEDSETLDNCLVFAIQPSEGIQINLQVKRPGFGSERETAVMDFDYDRHFNAHGHRPDAYERVLVDAICGDRTLFATSDEVLASWRILDAVVAAWSADAGDLALYQPGSDGPALPASFTI